MAAGHPLSEVLGYTPRQVEGLLFLAERRQTKDAALSLSIAAAGARGDPKEVRSQVKKWSKA